MLPWLSLLLVQVNFGILFATQKVALTTLTPLGLLTIRVLGACVVFESLFYPRCRKTLPFMAGI